MSNAVLGYESNLPRAIVPDARPARQTWVDQAKGVGILLVVFGHVWLGLAEARLLEKEALYFAVYGWMYNFHMPLFFLFSGLFVARSVQKGAKVYFTDKLKGVLYPFVVWSLIQGLSGNVLAHLGNSKVTFDPVANLLWAPYAQFWFLYVLMICFVLYFLMHHARLGVWGIFGVTLAWYATTEWLSMGSWGVPYQVRNYFFYFVLGATLRDPIMSLIANARPGVALGVAILLFDALTATVAFGYGWDVNFTNPTLALVGIAATLSLAAALDGWRIRAMAFLGRYSLQIFLAHTLVVALVRVVLMKLLHIDSFALHLAAGTILGLAAPLALVWVAARLRCNWIFALK